MKSPQELFEEWWNSKMKVVLLGQVMNVSTEDAFLAGFEKGKESGTVREVPRRFNGPGLP